MVETAVPFYGLRFRIFELEVRFRHFAHTMGSMLFNKVVTYSRVTIRPPFGGHVLLFDQKKFVLRGRPKWPNVLLIGIMNSKIMSNHSPTKNFGKFLCKQQPAT